MRLFSGTAQFRFPLTRHVVWVYIFKNNRIVLSLQNSVPRHIITR